MARPRKNAARAQASLLPPDEVVEIPVEEQPYPLPKGWKWVRLGSVCSFIGGGTPDKSQKEYWDGDIPWASVKDVKGTYLYSTIDHISELGLKNSAANICDVDDLILVTRISPAKTIISKIKTSINQDLKIVKSNIPVKFLYLYFCNFEGIFLRKSSGTTVRGITIHNIETTPFPLPSLDVQQRIVDRIESLFAKLDEAKEKAEAVLNGFEIRKAAILHKAFTGELTAKWRSEQGIGLESWDIKKIGQCGTWVGGGTPSTAHSEYWDEGKILWITSKDMKYDIITDTLLHINEKAIENSSAILVKKPSIIFVLRSGILRRKLPIAMVEKEFTINQDLKSLTPTNIFIVKFLFYQCKNLAKKILHTCVKDGTTVESIKFNALKNVDVFVPSIPEQQEIVRILDSLLAKEQQVKEAAENVLNQIDLMKKAILSRAFRGELTRHIHN